jgi:hypothetical protein
MSDVDGCRLPWSSLLNMMCEATRSEEFDSLAMDGPPPLVGFPGYVFAFKVGPSHVIQTNVQVAFCTAATRILDFE